LKPVVSLGRETAIPDRSRNGTSCEIARTLLKQFRSFQSRPEGRNRIQFSRLARSTYLSKTEIALRLSGAFSAGRPCKAASSVLETSSSI